MFHNFGYVTTSDWLDATLDFRHEIAPAVIAGDLHISYIVINSCVVFGTTCICKTSKVIGTSGTSAAILDFWRTSTSQETGSTTIKKFDPENIGVAVEILSLYALELDICLRYFVPPFAGKRRKKPLPVTICFAYSFRIHIHKRLLTIDQKSCHLSVHMYS